MRCIKCNSLCKKENKYNYDDPVIGNIKIDLIHYICEKCNNIQSLSINKMDEINHQQYLKRKEILMMKYSNNNEWMTLNEAKKEINNINKNRLFYIIENHKCLFLRKSIENYKKYNDGLFWIGDENIFKLNNEIDYLRTMNIHILDNYIIEIGYSNGIWKQFDTKKFLNFTSKNEFIEMHHYGYGGLIWNNGNKIDHLTIWNNSINYKTNKKFNDLLKVEEFND